MGVKLEIFRRELWTPEKLQEIEEFKERVRKRREEKLLRDAQQKS
uniref:PET100 cytochrome c oxidase chaperone n=5 Tax=Cercopithecinae TaxID=9528 RepID=A0A2I3LV08_PAPAN